MLISHALLVFLSITSFKYQDIASLINNMGQHVTWTTPDRTEKLTRDQAIYRLQELLANLSKVKIEEKHQSDWKNKKCFRVLQLTSDTSNYRIFYYCSLVDGREIVDKIKVTKL